MAPDIIMYELGMNSGALNYQQTKGFCLLRSSTVTFLRLLSLFRWRLLPRGKIGRCRKARSPRSGDRSLARPFKTGPGLETKIEMASRQRRVKFACLQP